MSASHPTQQYAPGLQPSDRPIFVVGAPRSGTTLLQRMLRSHPRISSPTGESHFFIPLFRDATTFGDLTQRKNLRSLLRRMYEINPNFLDTDLHGMQFDIEALADEFHDAGHCSVPAVIGALFSKNAIGEGKARWLDKTPYYVLHIPTILQMYPQAQFVHIIRDGRDVVLSMIDRRHDLAVYNIYHGAKMWQQYIEAGREHAKTLRTDQYFELRYEDILSDPSISMRELCNFLTEAFDESLIHFQKSRDPKTKTPLLRKDLQYDNFDKWKEKMSRRQINTFEAAAADTLGSCGYSLTTSSPTLPLPVRAAYRLHNRLCEHMRRFGLY